MSISVNIDEKLAVNKYFVDEGNPHIILKQNPDMAIFELLEKACPAGLYRRDENGNAQFDSAGCLECGTCRLLAGGLILEKWDFPQGSLGVEYRMG